MINLFLITKTMGNRNCKLINYILECFRREKYKLGLEFISHLDILDREELESIYRGIKI